MKKLHSGSKNQNVAFNMCNRYNLDFSFFHKSDFFPAVKFKLTVLSVCFFLEITFELPV